ncbi:GNAT family N-acetyltransferase [Isoptericola rhizosphaerae]|uniref:GNAT family N-acetyltransferase n=1 Tax=Isoptericola rhizosphaerae TaxID=3377837 RepID=UPI00383A8A8A
MTAATPAAGGTGLIRPERPADFAAVRALLTAAFDDGGEVADGVERIRASWIYRPELSLVAIDAETAERTSGSVAGFVMVTGCTVTGPAGSRTVAMLTPLAVAPDRQRRGRGATLVRSVLELADRAGEPFVVLEGSPHYYGRFGFEDARPHGIRLTLPDWAPPEAGQVRLLSSYDAGDRSLRGAIGYPAVYG